MPQPAAHTPKSLARRSLTVPCRPPRGLQVAHLHKEFEDVSAPMATMTLLNLTKFQTRVLRKHGDKFMKRLSMGNPIHALKKGTGDKELRDQAKKTATLGYFRPRMLCILLSLRMYLSPALPCIVLTLLVRLRCPSVCASVFKRLGYWDEETKEPIPEKTVSFDEWLAIVYKTKVNHEVDHSKAGAYTPSQERRNGRYVRLSAAPVSVPLPLPEFP
jgi:hypothetical protein